MPVKDVINIDRYEINDMIVENKKNIYSVKFLQKDVQLAGLLIEKKITTLKLFFDFNVRKIVIKDEELLPQNLTILEFISKLRETNKVTIEFDNAEQASTITYPILMNNEEIFTIKFCD